MEPSPFELTYYTPSETKEALKSEISHKTLVAWRNKGFILAVEGHYPESNKGFSHYVRGYVDEFGDQDEALQRFDPTTRLEKFAQTSMRRALLTKQIYDHTVAAYSYLRPDGQHYIETDRFSELVGLSDLSINRYLPSYADTGHTPLSYLNQHVTWHHRAFQLPAREQQRLLEG